MEKQAIRTGIIGYGLSGRVFHAPFIHHLPEFELTSVCSRQAEAIRERYPDTAVFEESSRLIESDLLDLVIITAPNTQHFPLAEAAIKAGKDVLLEKPSVSSLQEIETLAKLAKNEGKLLSVYQNRRFDGDFLHLKALVDSGELGTLRHLTSRFDRFRPKPQDRWRELPGPASGIFWDLGPHLLDQTLHLLGAPDSLEAHLGVLRRGGTTTDWFDILLTYPECQVSLGSTPFEPGPMQRFNARFEQGSWQCWGLDPQEEALRNNQMPWHTDFPGKGLAQTAQRYHAGNNGAITTVEDNCEPGHYQNYFRQLAMAIKTRNGPPVSLTDACALIYTLELAERSSREGKRLHWQYP